MARQKLKPRKDGRYQTSVMFRGERVWFYGRTQAEALRAKADFLADNLDLCEALKRPTVEQRFWAKLLTNPRRRSRDPSSMARS